MTTRPRAKIGRHLLPGLAAVALFVIMATVYVRAEFGAILESVGYPDGSITASIGYALFDLTGQVDGAIPSDSFLAAFEIVDVLLVAALVGAIMLARRDVGGSIRTAIADGGRDLFGNDEGGED